MSQPPAPDDGLSLLRKQAAGGAPVDLFALASALVARGDMEEAGAVHLQAARLGHLGAQIEYARMRLYGVGCAVDPLDAVRWLERAETAGQPVAGYLLAMIALGSVALPRDGRINTRVLTAVKADYPPALRAAAIHFGRKDHPQDQQRCLQLLGRGSNLGDVVAAQLLVERLRRGEGCPPQPQAAEALAAQLRGHGIPLLPACTAPLPPPVLPLRSGQVPPGTLTLEDALQVPPMHVLAQRPHVMQIDQLLSADECRLLMASAMPALRRSRTVDPLTGQVVTQEIRTSTDASFDPLLEDLALRVVQLRIARAARMELSHAEQLIVLRYAPGEEYRPHRDYLPPSTLEADHPEAGNRARTICVYLNHVEAGGETEFGLPDLRVAPVPGRAVVFDNLTPDGRPDPESLHAGVAVRRGEKWLATLWLRQRRYRAY